MERTRFEWFCQTLLSALNQKRAPKKMIISYHISNIDISYMITCCLPSTKTGHLGNHDEDEDDGDEDDGDEDDDDDHI